MSAKTILRKQSSQARDDQRLGQVHSLQSKNLGTSTNCEQGHCTLPSFDEADGKRRKLITWAAPGITSWFYFQLAQGDRTLAQTETRTVWVKRPHRHIRGIQHLRSTRVTNGQLFHATKVWIGPKPDLKCSMWRNGVNQIQSAPEECFEQKPKKKQVHLMRRTPGW